MGRTSFSTLSRLRVCHISDCHSVNDNRIFLKECTSLSKDGYSVTLIAVGESDFRNGVSRIGIKRRGVLGRIFKTRLEILRFVKQSSFDIIHLHDPTLLLLVRFLKRKDIKVIFDSHEDYYQQIQYKSYLPKKLRRIISTLYKEYQSKISKQLDGFIFPATGSNVDVQVPITIVGNSPIVEHQNLKSSIGRPISERERCVCYVGSITKDRGITQLIHAAYLARCKLILAGQFAPQEYYEECKRMEEYSVVDYRGNLPHTEIKNIINESKIGMAVLLNHGQYGNTRNLATKVTEYCLHGLPVFLNRTPHNLEMTKKYQFGICVNPENILEYAEQLNNYLDKDEELVEMGKNGRNLVITELNWENEYKNLKTLYDNIAKDLK